MCIFADRKMPKLYYEYEISHRTTVSAREPASFWRKKRESKSVVVSKQVKKFVTVLAFFDQQKGLVSSNKNNWATWTDNKEYD